MTGPSKVCALVITKSKVDTEPIVFENELGPLQCPQRKFGIVLARNWYLIIFRWGCSFQRFICTSIAIVSFVKVWALSPVLALGLAMMGFTFLSSFSDKVPTLENYRHLLF